MVISVKNLFIAIVASLVVLALTIGIIAWTVNAAVITSKAINEEVEMEKQEALERVESRIPNSLIDDALGYQAEEYVAVYGSVYTTWEQAVARANRWEETIMLSIDLKMGLATLNGTSSVFTVGESGYFVVPIIEDTSVLQGGN